PGDVLQCRYWTNGEVAYPTISAEQILVLPLIGEFETRGKTLAQLKDEVYQKASDVFRESKLKGQQNPLSLSLFQPRRIYVTVKGNVATPNVYALSGSTRADIAVSLANKIDLVPSGDLTSQRQMQLE